MEINKDGKMEDLDLDLTCLIGKDMIIQKSIPSDSVVIQEPR